MTGLTNGTRYSFRVLAKNAVGHSAPSNVVNAIPAHRAVGSRSLRAVPGNRQVTLVVAARRRPTAAPITDYIIQRLAERHVGGPRSTTGSARHRSFTVTGLTNGTRYSFRVLAKNAAGNSAPSQRRQRSPPHGALGTRRCGPHPATSARSACRGCCRRRTAAPITDYIIQRSPNGTSGWIDDQRRRQHGAVVQGRPA